MQAKRRPRLKRIARALFQTYPVQWYPIHHIKNAKEPYLKYNSTRSIYIIPFFSKSPLTRIVCTGDLPLPM